MHIDLQTMIYIIHIYIYIYIYIYLMMRFIAHTFSIGWVGLYFIYKPTDRLIFATFKI